MSTAVPASPPEARDVRKLTSVILEGWSSGYIRFSDTVSLHSIKHHIKQFSRRQHYLQIFIFYLAESERSEFR